MKFDREALDATLLRHGAQLIGDYPKMNKRIRVYFRCKCGGEGNKLAFEIINRVGAFCKPCTNHRATNKLHETISKNRGDTVKCNLNRLDEVIRRDNAILMDHYESMTNRTPIHFRCSCGNESTKDATQLIVVSGAFCKVCTRNTWRERTKKTNLEKYGHVSPTQNSEIKDKITKKLLELYGVDNVFKSPLIKEKIKETNREKYGVDYTSQSSEFREKIKKTSIKKYGTENPAQSAEVKKKMKETNLRLYGVEYSIQNKQIQERKKKSNL